MHLIDTDTLKLTSFQGKLPRYAILSHTWDSDELSFAEFGDLPKRESHPGFEKIKSTCQQARRDGLDYAWIDTCCINKESSAELSEAINSMFRWYQDATICYTYIDDLPDDLDLPITSSSLIKDCRWFSRGWTLQELLAPQNVIFFGPRWDKIGCKSDLLGVLEEITRVPRAVLAKEERLDRVSVADRMNWAARRETTREEDMAYCLMGIFDVNMPMIYGEGGRKAFLRLQEEILKQTQDDSLFAWRATDEDATRAPYRGLLAASPADFASDVSIKSFYTSMAGPTTIQGDGHVLLSCAKYDDGILGLKCTQGTDVSKIVGIQVIKRGRHYLRSHPSSLIDKPHKNPAAYDPVMFERSVERSENKPPRDVYLCDALHLAEPPPGVRLVAVHPIECEWQKGNMVPVVYAVNKKVAFELEIDQKMIGANLFRSVGRNEDMTLGRRGHVHVLLVVRVRQLPDTDSYTYYFDLVCIGDKTAKTSFERAEGALQALQRVELNLGWSTLQVQAGDANVDGQIMFSFTTSLVVRENLKAQVKALERERQEADERRRRERQEALHGRPEGTTNASNVALYSGCNIDTGLCIEGCLPVLHVFAWLALGLFMYFYLNNKIKAEP